LADEDIGLLPFQFLNTMNKLTKSLVIGVIAGALDVLPMIAQSLAWNANLSAFLHWVFLGIIIAYIEFGVKGWLKGLIIALASAIPFVLITGVDSVIPIVLMSAVLGVLVGIATEKFAKS
jgi:hypothetical protein